MGFAKKLLPLLVLLLAVGAVLVGVGWLRPVRHVARSRGVYRTPVEKVWERLSNVEVWPSWVESFHTVQTRPDVDGHPAFSVGTEFGDAVLVLERVQAPGSMTTLLDAGSFRGRWTYELVDVPAGSELTITEVGDVESPFYRGMMMFMDPNESMDTFLTELGAALECETSVDQLPVTLEEVVAGEEAK